MTLTTDWLTGFEAGVLSINGGGTSGGGGNGDILTAGVSTVTSGQRNGARACQCAPTASANSQYAHVAVTAARRGVFRVALKITAAPGSGTLILARMQATTGGGTKEATIQGVYVDATHVKLQALFGGGTPQDGPTIVAGAGAVWKCIEVNADVGATTWTLDWKVDGLAQTQAVRTGQSADTIKRFYIGTGVGTGPAATILYDDWIMGFSSSGSADEWFGDGKVLGYSPASDGTHTFTSQNASEGDGTTTWITSATTNVYEMVNDMPMSNTRSTSDNVAQRVAAAEYAEVIMTASDETVNANAVIVKLAYSSSASSSGNTAGCIVRNSAGTAAVIWGDFPTAQGGNNGSAAAYNVTSNNYKFAIVPKPVAGWTDTEVNLIRVRMGCRTGTQLPTWQTLIIEADWPVQYPAKTVTVAQVAETDTATVTTHRHTRSGVQVGETDTAATIRAQRVYAIAQVSESDTATALSRKLALEVTVTQVTETDTVTAITKRKARLTGQVVETDTSVAVSHPLPLLHRSGKQIVTPSGTAAFLRTVNLGNWTLWSGWELGGNALGELLTFKGSMHRDILPGLVTLTGDAAAVDAWVKDYFDAYVTETDIIQLRKTGFNCVRVLLNHRDFDDYDDATNYTNPSVDMDGYGWTLLDNLFDWCETHNMYVVLDMHAAPGGQGLGYTADPGPVLLWDSSTLQTFTATLWGAIAGRYGNRSSLAGYDILNEPFEPDSATLTTLYENCIAAIRAEDTDHIIFLEGNNTGSSFDWALITSPDTLDSNIVLSGHFYKFGVNYLATRKLVIFQAEELGYPLWIGEYGQDSVINVATQIDWIEAFSVVVGLGYYSFKKYDVDVVGLLTFDPGANWDAVIAWLDNNTAPQPNAATTIQAMADVLTALGSLDYNYRMEAMFHRYSRAVYEDGASYYWRLNETSGTVANDTGTLVNEGAFAGGVTLGQQGIITEAPDNLAITSDGTGEVTTAVAFMLKTAGLSMECWFKTTSAGVLMSVTSGATGVSTDVNQILYIDSGGYLRFGMATSGGKKTAVSDVTVTDDKWHHAVGVMSTGANKDLHIYLDGRSAGTTANTSSGWSLSRYVRVGYGLLTGFTNATVSGFTGSIAQAAYYNVAGAAGALTAEQVASHYAIGLGIQIEQLIELAASAVITPHKAAAPKVIDVTQVTETDSVTSIGTAKTRTVGLVTETDTPGIVRCIKTRSFGQVTETDTSTAVRVGKMRTVSQVTETDTATLLTGANAYLLGTVTETDTAGIVRRIKIHSISAVTETDSATAVSKVRSRVIGQAAETDTATALTGLVAHSVSPATETDTATVIRRVKTHLVSFVTETDSATAVSKKKTRLVGQVTETDGATSVHYKLARYVAKVTEIDTATVVTCPGRINVVSEIDTALPVHVRLVRLIARVTETETATTARHIKIRVATQVTESETATSVLHSKRKGISGVTERESATPTVRVKIRSVACINELDTSTGVSKGKAVILTPVGELDSSTSLDRLKVHAVTQVTEIDVAHRMFFGLYAELVTVNESDTATRIKVMWHYPHSYGSDGVATYHGRAVETYGSNLLATYRGHS